MASVFNGQAAPHAKSKLSNYFYLIKVYILYLSTPKAAGRVGQGMSI